MATPDVRAPLDGVLVIDKPEGLTSHDVVARVRRATGCRRVGHTGTLDPLATGVLALVLGRATRLARFLAGQDKQYETDITLGRETDSYDADGNEVARHEGPLPSAAEVEAAVERLRDQEFQVPPPFSAKKVAGTRAYRLARRNEPPALAPVRVVLREAELVRYDPPVARVRLTASAGFYVRSLAHDLGAALGCGAHVAALRRTRTGDFDLEHALPLAALVDTPALVPRHLVPLSELLPGTDVVRLTPLGASRARHGNLVTEAECVEAMPGARGGPVRLLDPEGRLVGLATGGRIAWPLHPDVVLD